MVVLNTGHESVIRFSEYTMVVEMARVRTGHWP
jgi:hypothetical protein